MELDVNVIIGLVSVLIAFVATVLACFSTLYSYRVERDRKYNIFYDNINAIYVFIHDSFSIMSNGQFADIVLLKEAEKSLDLGIHKMKSYALINKLLNLDIFSLINSDDEEECEKSFSNSLLCLETKYYEYRQSHMSGDVSSEDEKTLSIFLGLFQRFDDLIARYSDFFLSKRKCNQKRRNYYEELKNLREAISSLQ